MAFRFVYAASSGCCLYHDALVNGSGYNSDSHTFMFWMRLTATPSATVTGVPAWLYNDAPSNTLWHVFFTAGTSQIRLVSQVAGGTVINNAGSTLTVGTWYHIAIVANTNHQFVLYINGVADINNNHATAGTVAFKHLRFGGNGGDNIIEADMACIKIFNAPLSVELLNEEYQRMVPVDYSSVRCTDFFPIHEYGSPHMDWSGVEAAANRNLGLTQGSGYWVDGPPVPWGANPLIVQAPGTTNYRNVSTRFKLRVQAFKDAATRFRLNVRNFKDAATRLRLRAQGYKDAATRVLLRAQGYKDTLTRVRLIPGAAARPTVDISDGTWTPSTGSDLYATIDESTPSDTDYMYSATTPVNDTAIIQLGPLQDPHIDDGYRVRVRISKDQVTGDTINLNVVLQAGTTDIASALFTDLSADWTDYSFLLTPTEVAAFRSNGGFANPRLKFVANKV